MQRQPRRGQHRAAAAARRNCTGAVERCYALDANAGDGQLRTYEGTCDTGQYQVLCAVADGGENVVDRCFSNPASDHGAITPITIPPSTTSTNPAPPPHTH